jgi:lipopolysaccharide transport system permease protein
MTKAITIIKPKSGLIPIDFKEIWEYRELFLAFAIRDMKVKYKQTIFGVLWVIIQPLTQMVIFSFFFGKLAQIPSDGVPYPIFSYSGLLLWTFFSSSLSAASNGVLTYAGMFNKIYFPKIIIPAIPTVIFFLDYLVAFVILFFLMAFYRFPITINFIFIPFIVLSTWLLATGIGFWLSSLNYKFRDIRYALPFFIQLLIYITPVIYPASVAGQFEWLVNLNPMTGYIETHRALILGLPIKYNQLVISAILSVFTFISGMYFFKSTEKKIVDII